MSTFVNNDVASGNTIFASDHNEMGSRIAAVVNGGLDNSNIAAGAAIATSKLADDAGVTTAKIADGAVTPAKLATSAITLGYAQITSNFTGTATSFTDVTGLSTTVTIPSGGRRVKVSVGGQYMASTAAAATGLNLQIVDVTAGVVIGGISINSPGNSYGVNCNFVTTTVPASGSRTYKLQYMQFNAGTFSLGASITQPAFILVEAI